MVVMRFSTCFNPKKIAKFIHWVEPTVKTVQGIGLMHGFFRKKPVLVRCMSHDEIAEGMLEGKGHGLYLKDEIALNSHLPWKGIYLNFIHELFHHYVPSASDQEINDKYVPMVYGQITGKRLKKSDWKQWRGTNPCRYNQ